MQITNSPFFDGVHSGDAAGEPVDVVAVVETATYTLGALAEEFSISHRTIREYEEEGLLRPHRQGTIRIYSQRDRRRLELILRGKKLGFTLPEIREFLDLYIVDTQQIEQMRFLHRRCMARCKVLEDQKKAIDTLLDELRATADEAMLHLRKHDLSVELDGQGTKGSGS